MKNKLRVLSTYSNDSYIKDENTLCFKIDDEIKKCTLVDVTSENASNIRYKYNNKIKAVGVSRSLLASYYKFGYVLSPEAKEIWSLTGKTNFDVISTDVERNGYIDYIKELGLYVCYGRYANEFYTTLSFSKDGINWITKKTKPIIRSSGTIGILVSSLFSLNGKLYGIADTFQYKPVEYDYGIALIEFKDIYNTVDTELDCEITSSFGFPLRNNVFKSRLTVNNICYICEDFPDAYQQSAGSVLYSFDGTNFKRIFGLNWSHISYNNNENILYITDINNAHYIISNDFSKSTLIADSQYKPTITETLNSYTILDKRKLEKDGIIYNTPCDVVGFAPEYNTWYGCKEEFVYSTYHFHLYYCDDITKNQWIEFKEVVGERLNFTSLSFNF
ncbi:MAG: hypothetical protein MJ179_07910 [Treponema sp.]|nr:hypothetical protein [Treponema sp.]